MSVNVVNSDGSLLRVAGGTLYADAPIGTISPFGGSAIPSGYLLCNGQAVSRTTYAALFTAIGVAFGSGDGSTTFNVPDLRETVPVGSGTRGSGVTTHDTYDVGQFKDDQLQDHAHYGVWSRREGTYFEGVSSSEYAMQDNPLVSHEGVYGARTGSTTHGKQLGVNYIIKAKQVAVPFDIAEYIRNQNVLSEWETSTDSFTAEYDGYFEGREVGGSTVTTLTINGTAFGTYGNYPTYMCIPLKKGDIISSNLIGCKVAYYKLRDYSGR